MTFQFKVGSVFNKMAEYKLPCINLPTFAAAAGSFNFFRGTGMTEGWQFYLK